MVSEPGLFDFARGCTLTLCHVFRQSETAADASQPVPPRVIVSRPADDGANIFHPTRIRPAAARRPASRQQPLSSPSEWIDIDEESPPRQRRSKRYRSERVSRHSTGKEVREGNSSRAIERYLPRLSRILEGSEFTTSSRSPVHGPERKRNSEEGSKKRSRHRDDISAIQRRSARYRTTGIQRRSDHRLNINSSLLSVLTSLTSNSDKSSGSSSTITQQSYARREGGSAPRQPGRRPRHTEAKRRPTQPYLLRPSSPNVFDYMVGSSVDDGHDSLSIMSSSSSSHYEPSIAGSSEAPDTPSSRSTFPSPTSSRSFIAELRRKHDPLCAGNSSSVRSNSRSPDSSLRSTRNQPNVCEVIGDEDEPAVEPAAISELNSDVRDRSSSRSSRSSQRSTDRMKKQEESMRHHMAYANQAQHAHYVNPMYGQHRSPSVSSVHSEHAAYAYQIAMQQYRWPSPPSIAPQSMLQPMNGHISPPDRPPAPDAPDLSQRTILGYEMLALELSSSDSPVRPIYRRFEYLNHRILLHLQDELSELEEQLRTVDEIIAQTDAASADGQHSPSSRRGEAYSSNELHHRRINLLGKVFTKTEQYNRAMNAYTSMIKDAAPADPEEVQAYQEWMTKHVPVHEIETRFLQRGQDLIVPGKAQTGIDRPTKHATLAYLPVALMLPLLLYSIIPSLAGRLAVTALIAVGAFIVAATTRIRHLMPPREWAVCGAAYVLLMAAIAGCIPQHAT